MNIQTNQNTAIKPCDNILIVDDDKGIRDLLGQFLQQHGYKTVLAKDGSEMFQSLKQHECQLIILDIMLPGDDGIKLCQRIRKTSQIPIIMLTAMGEDIDRIHSLEMGADDHLSKPFNPRELLARVKARLRYHHNFQQQQNKSSEAESYQFAGWRLHKTERCLISADNIEISLSSGEYNLLVAFLEHPQEVLNRDQLLELTAKNRCAGPFDRSIDIQVSRLRYKIEEDAKNPALIKTVRGGGYVLATTVDQH